MCPSSTSGKEMARSNCKIGRRDKCSNFNHWDDPETVIKNLLGAVAPGGILLIHDLKRVWWLYWIPSQEGFITSIRAAYTPAEIRDLLTRMGVDRYEIKNGLFWQSIIVRTYML